MSLRSIAGRLSVYAETESVPKVQPEFVRGPGSAGTERYTKLPLPCFVAYLGHQNTWRLDVAGQYRSCNALDYSSNF